jgi:hypothetical protein
MVRTRPGISKAEISISLENISSLRLLNSRQTAREISEIEAQKILKELT